ncbi:MAG: hypothetical protein HY446_00420 [Candidatus Niyogibacteria bacterium]|nr:hypothetical protein [Candidatus Niyogibacteria bacterium]
MEKKAAIIVLVSFFSLAVLSVFVMTMESGHGYGCLAETARGALCPFEKSSISFLNFHLGIFKTFSAVILFSLTLFALFGARLAVHSFNDAPNGIFQALGEAAPIFVSPSQLKSRSWLSFHENSPSFV